MPLPARFFTPLLVASSFLLAGCGLLEGAPIASKGASPSPSSKNEPAPADGSTPGGAARFGTRLSARPSTPLATVLEAPDKFADQTVLVEGHVRRACSRKGCWMEVSTTPEKEALGCRVTFEDYAFFVPTDAAGSTARVEGKVVVTRVKPAHVEHLESEGGTFEKKNEDGSAIEVQLVATGVELSRG